MTIPSGTPKLVMLLPIPNFFSHVLTQVPKLATGDAAVTAMSRVDMLFFSSVAGEVFVRRAHGRAEENDLQGVTLLERRDDILGEEVQNEPEQAVQLGNAPSLTRKLQIKERQGQQNRQGAEQIDHADEMEDHPFADPAECGGITDTIDAPGHRQEHQRSRNGAKNIEEGIIYRQQELIQKSGAQRIRQPQSGTSNQKAHAYGQCQRNKWVHRRLLQLEKKPILPLNIAVKGQQTHIGHQPASICTKILILFAKRIVRFSGQIDLDIGPPQRFPIFTLISA